MISSNKAFLNLTRRSHELIGSSFYELFVSESNHSPSMATTPTLLGLFNNDIVRVLAKKQINEDSWLDGGNDDDMSTIGSIGDTDETDIFCKIKIDGVPTDGANLQYFSIQLAPLQVPKTLSLSNNNNNNLSSSIVYLPMPCGGSGVGANQSRPGFC